MRARKSTVPQYTHCQSYGCIKTVTPGKKYCSRDHAPFSNLLDPTSLEASKRYDRGLGMKIAAAKAKGRRLCESVRQEIFKIAPELKDADIYVTPSSSNGPDLLLSPAAELAFPFAIECKNQEQAAIWKWVDQAKRHIDNKPELDRPNPMLIIGKNRHEPWAVVPLETFMKVYAKAFRSKD